MFIHKNDFLKYSTNMLEFVRKSSNIYKDKIKSGTFSFYCSNCCSFQKANSSDDWSLRNQVICEKCGLGGRFRHLYEIIEKIKPSELNPNVALFEDVTLFTQILKRKYINLKTSEYFDGYKSGDLVQYPPIKDYFITNQDIQNTSYESDSIDLIIHGDVYEHIPSIEEALVEAKRILKPDGYMIFTMPFYDFIDETVVRVEVKNNKLNFLMPKHYHGNPLSEKGALVFTEPGREFLNLSEKVGFNVKLSLGYDPLKGYFPDCNESDQRHCWNLVFVLSLSNQQQNNNQINSSKLMDMNLLTKNYEEIKKINQDLKNIADKYKLSNEQIIESKSWKLILFYRKIIEKIRFKQKIKSFLKKIKIKSR